MTYEYVTSAFGGRAINPDRFTRKTAEHLARMGRTFVDDPENPAPAPAGQRIVEQLRRSVEKGRIKRYATFARFYEQAHKLLDEERERLALETLATGNEADSMATRVFALHQIMRETCKKYEISRLDLISECRSQRFTHARQECMWRMRKETVASTTAIGRMLRRDHTTVMHGVQAHQRRLDDAAGGGADERQSRKPESQKSSLEEDLNHV